MPFTMPIRAFVLAAAAAVVAAAGALVQPASAAAEDCPGAGSRALSVRQATSTVFCLVNRERTSRGLPALRHSGRLARVAGVHARDSVRYGFVGHTSPVHGTLGTRVRRSGYRPTGGGAFAIGEILGAGRGRRGTPRAIVRAWMRRHIHRTAILYPRFRTMGVGGTRGMPSRRSRGRNFVITFAS